VRFGGRKTQQAPEYVFLGYQEIDWKEARRTSLSVVDFLEGRVLVKFPPKKKRTKKVKQIAHRMEIWKKQA